MKKNLKFPKGFLWGSATAAYQVEGGIENNDWSKDFPAGKACDHYNRYEEDFDLAKELNHNAYRFSIEWARIEPKEGKFDKKEISHYRKVLCALHEREINSFVTLHHFTFPLWLAKKGGGTYRGTTDCFERYVKFLVEELGDLVNFWITLNEPVLGSVAGYLLKMGPIQERSLLKTIQVIQNGIRTHKRAYEVIHGLNKNAKVGVAKNNIYFEPYKPRAFLDRFCILASRYFWNEYFLNRINSHLDFVGLNYYFHYRIKFPFLIKNENEITSDLGWEIYPEGIYWVLRELKKYRKPIYITENGVADARDKLRPAFIENHLLWIHKAIQEAINVRGYFHWSLMDNFEWKESFRARFGLIQINYKTLQRKLRPSSLFYGKICKENSLKIKV
jgi:beta-glucosidase